MSENFVVVLVLFQNSAHRLDDLVKDGGALRLECIPVQEALESRASTHRDPVVEILVREEDLEKLALLRTLLLFPQLVFSHFKLAMLLVCLVIRRLLRPPTLWSSRGRCGVIAESHLHTVAHPPHAIHEGCLAVRRPLHLCKLVVQGVVQSFHLCQP